MSRIGKKPILVPATCKVAVNAATREVAITGPKGETLKLIHREARTIRHAKDVLTDSLLATGSADALVGLSVHVI